MGVWIRLQCKRVVTKPEPELFCFFVMSETEPRPETVLNPSTEFVSWNWRYYGYSRFCPVTGYGLFSPVTHVQCSVHLVNDRQKGVALYSLCPAGCFNPHKCINIPPMHRKDIYFYATLSMKAG